jgi:hypothetical protein
MIHFIYLHDYLAPQSQGPEEDDGHVPTPYRVTVNQRKPPRRSHHHPVKRAPLSEAGPDGDYHIAMHARMYALGSKYGINSLKVVSRDKFSQAISSVWCHRNFVKAVEIVFSTTPDEDKGLRDIAVRMIKQKESALFARKDMRECIRCIEGLAFNLLMHDHMVEEDENTVACESCGCSHVYDCENCGERCRCHCRSFCESCGHP